MRNVIFRVLMAILVAGLDIVEEVVWVTLPVELMDLDDSANENASVLTKVIVAKIWEMIFCAAPDIKGARIEVQIETTTLDGIYEKPILSPDAAFTAWTPELSDMVNEASVEIKKDLKDMLVDMVGAYVIGDTGRGDPRYEIHQHD